MQLLKTPFIDTTLGEVIVTGVFRSSVSLTTDPQPKRRIFNRTKSSPDYSKESIIPRELVTLIQTFCGDPSTSINIPNSNHDHNIINNDQFYLWWRKFGSEIINNGDNNEPWTDQMSYDTPELLLSKWKKLSAL